MILLTSIVKVHKEIRMRFHLWNPFPAPYSVIFFMVEANCPDNEPSGLDETGKIYYTSKYNILIL